MGAFNISLIALCAARDPSNEDVSRFHRSLALSVRSSTLRREITKGANTGVPALLYNHE